MLDLLEYTWPFLLFEGFFLISGILMLLTGIKIRRQHKWPALLVTLLSSVIIPFSIYLLYWTFMLGYNS